jgi:hypothetical protein
MKKLLIALPILIASCTPPMVSQPKCDCTKQDSIIKVYEQRLHEEPNTENAPYMTEDMMLEGEFQDDTIGQSEY